MEGITDKVKSGVPRGCAAVRCPCMDDEIVWELRWQYRRRGRRLLVRFLWRLCDRFPVQLWQE